MREIQATLPHLCEPTPHLFLAGSIEMGAAERWQDKVVAALRCYGGTILNPRRDDWDSSWEQSIENPQFVEQVEWELSAMDTAEIVACYFSPDTKSPITLLELGQFHHKMVVYCPAGFWRKGNVDVFCRKYEVPQARTWDEWIAWLASKLRKENS